MWSINWSHMLKPWDLIVLTLWNVGVFLGFNMSYGSWLGRQCMETKFRVVH